MPRIKFVLFAASLPRLSIGCAITGLIATAIRITPAGLPTLLERRFLGGEAEPRRAVSVRLTVMRGPLRAVRPRTQVPVDATGRASWHSRYPSHSACRAGVLYDFARHPLHHPRREAEARG